MLKKDRCQDHIELLQGTPDLLALHRMERQKLIASEWAVSENNQRTKVYHITTAGKKQLASERSHWDQLVEAIARAMNPGKKRSET